VDENDNPLGKHEKFSAHQRGLLHRAFSVFIFNTKGELLLQQRANEKYHSGGLWSNTCCSHPAFGEDIKEAIKRRLPEEMGIRCETKFAFSFVYRAEFENGLIEHEYDHVYFGLSDQKPIPDNSEVKNFRYINLDDLKIAIMENPSIYSEWLRICLPRVANHFGKMYKTTLNKSYEIAYT